MPFFLKHHFDPDLDYANLKPEEQADGSVDHCELNFVQNVEAGSVIAEWVTLNEGEESVSDPRFVYEEMAFPAGRGTGIKRKHPNKLYAAVNGCVGYRDGKMVVDESLVLPSDVDYHTGNIDFIGNLTVGGSVRSGFSIQARSINIQGPVEGARVEALHTLNCPGGIKGSGEAFLESGQSMKLAFCENATLKAGDDILVKGALMHSKVFAGRRLAVGGRLTGGKICSHEYLYVGEQLGGGLDTDTLIILGYHPTLLFADEEYNDRIRILHDNIASYESKLKKGGEIKAEVAPKLESAVKELELVKLLKQKLWEGIEATERLEECKILVPGKVKPGVEISIGSAYLKVDDFLEDVFFYFKDNEIKIGNSTKKIKK